MFNKRLAHCLEMYAADLTRVLPQDFVSSILDAAQYAADNDVLYDADIRSSGHPERRLLRLRMELRRVKRDWYFYKSRFLFWKRLSLYNRLLRGSIKLLIATFLGATRGLDILSSLILQVLLHLFIRLWFFLYIPPCYILARIYPLESGETEYFSLCLS